jgi:MFS family permease
MAMRPAGYVAMLRRNRDFRRLWYGQLTSQLGDWLDAIALYTLLLNLTGSGAALGGLVVAQTLAPALAGLGSGVVIDRLPRRAVMIAADLGCAALVLLFLLVRRPDQVWIVYAVTAVKFTLTAFFGPAREALVSVVAGRDELVAANGLSGVTWSVMLVGGAALGGVVSGTLGPEAAFVLDAASFLISALCTWGVRVRETHLEGRAPSHPLRDLREGFAFLRGRPDVALYVTVKGLWGVGGGVLVLLTLFGREVFPLGKDGALGIGALYAARGVGAGVGPVLAQRWTGESVTALRRVLGPGFLLMALGYLLFSRATDLGWAAGALMLAHVGGSLVWVFSTVLLQLEVPGRLQGRLFAIELTLYLLTSATSSYATGLAADAGWPPRTLALVLSAAFVPSALLLALALWRPPRR